MALLQRHRTVPLSDGGTKNGEIVKFISGLLAVATSAGALLLAPSAAHASEVCDYKFTRSYTSEGYSWVMSDGETIRNTSSATVSRKITYTIAGSLSTTVSGEIALKASGAVAEVNAKFGVSVSASVTITRQDEFSVTVPAHTSISYRSGIIKRKYHVVEKTTYSNCDTKSKGGYASLADRLTTTKDV